VDVTPPVLERGRLLDLDLLRVVPLVDPEVFWGLTAGDPLPDRNLRFISSIASSVGEFAVPPTLVRGLLVLEGLRAEPSLTPDVRDLRYGEREEVGFSDAREESV
jgi:hypothetical protein